MKRLTKPRNVFDYALYISIAIIVAVLLSGALSGCTYMKNKFPNTTEKVSNVFGGQPTKTPTRN